MAERHTNIMIKMEPEDDLKLVELGPETEMEVDEGIIIPVPNAKAAKIYKFPPNAKVVHVSRKNRCESFPKITFGTIKSVGIRIVDATNHSVVYYIAPNDSDFNNEFKPLLADECELHWQEQTPVWFRLDGQNVFLAGIVVGRYFQQTKDGYLYSIQAHSGEVMNGLGIQSFKYRHEDSTPPPPESQNPIVNRNAGTSFNSDSIDIKKDFQQIQQLSLNAQFGSFQHLNSFTPPELEVPINQHGQQASESSTESSIVQTLGNNETRSCTGPNDNPTYREYETAMNIHACIEKRPIPNENYQGKRHKGTGPSFEPLSAPTEHPSMLVPLSPSVLDEATPIRLLNEITMHVIFPPWPDARDIKDTLIGSNGIKQTQFQREWNVFMKLKGIDESIPTSDMDRFYMAVSGIPKDINIAIREIMLRIVCLVDSEQENRLLYEFSMCNESTFATVDGLAAFNWVSPTFNHQTWTSIFNLPDTFPYFSGLFLGGNGFHIQRIERDSNSKVSTINSPRQEYLFIAGQNAEDVNHCHRLISEHLVRSMRAWRDLDR